MSAGWVLVLMAVLFLVFGYMGVPVSFALMAGVFLATAFTPVSLQSMVGQLFHGIDSETLVETLAGAPPEAGAQAAPRAAPPGPQARR